MAGSVKETLNVSRSAGRFDIHDSLLGQILGEGRESGETQSAQSQAWTHEHVNVWVEKVV